MLGTWSLVLGCAKGKERRGALIQTSAVTSWDEELSYTGEGERNGGG